MFNLNAVLNIVGANTASVRGAVSDINTEMDRGTRKARGFADSIALKGVNLGAYTATSLAVIKLTESISAATRDALRFEVEMAKIAQTVGISTEEAKKHGEEIRKLSVLYGLSAPKIAETVKVLGQAGYTLRQAKEAADSLAQTTLLASFESISDTTDGLIAVNKQFIETVGKSAEVLSVFNVVSKKYAVESSDLVEVVRKAGGTFSATGGKLEELLAVFTTVRDTTRESAETIAVGLRTIFSRLQRPKTIEYLKQFGIELVNLEGQFVGNFEAIQRIQRGLDAFNVRPGSIQFAEVVEKIGGVLQQSRVIPLLTQGAKLQQVYSDAQSATSQTAIDLAKAQDTLSFKIAQTQQNFAKMIGEIAGSDGFDTLVRGVLSMTNAMIHFGSAIKDVIPLVSALLAFNLAKSVGRLSLGGLGTLGGRRFASGGFVPGSGSGDTVPAMLTPGEFVIRKSAAQAMGAEALHGINKYAQGGVAKMSNRKTSLANWYDTSKGVDDLYDISPIREAIGQRQAYRDKASKIWNIASTRKTKAGANNYILKQTSGFAGKGSQTLGETELSQNNRDERRLNKIAGGLAEADFLKKFPNAKKLEDANGPDFRLSTGRYAEVKTNKGSVSDNELIAKALLGYGTDNKRFKNGEVDTVKPKIAFYQGERFASGGAVGTDTVPALLTPGEFVVNKKSAQAFGYGNLHKVNKYATGGRVGVQRFASGGPVGGDSLLPGLSGLGDLAIVVNQLIPTLGSMTSSFAKMSIAASLTASGLSGIFSAGKGVSDFFTAYKNEAKRLSDVRDAEYAAYKKASDKYDATSAELANAQIAAVTSSASIKATQAQRLQNKGMLSASPLEVADADAASRIARASSSTGKAQASLSSTEEAQARADMAASLKKLENTYTINSEQYDEATALLADLSDPLSMTNVNLRAQADALAKYTDLVIEGSVEQKELVEQLGERQRAEAKATAEASAKINTGGVRGKIGAGFRALSAEGEGGEALRAKAQAGIAAAGTAVIAASAYLVSSTRSAAQELESLSNAAVAAGNSQEAYNQSIAASAKEAQAAGIETGTSAGGAIGGAIAGIVAGAASFIPGFGLIIAPLIPIITSLGTVVGSAIGGFLGFTGAITAFTDWLGITNSEEEAKAKAQEKELAAGLVSADKISSTTLSKSSDIRKFDPKAADTILLKGVRELTNLIDTEQMIGNKEVQEQAKALFTAASSSIDELSNKSENAGKSFAQLSAENRNLFRAYEESSAIIEGNNAITQAQRAQIDAVAVVVNKEKQVRETAINVQLRQLAIQERVNQSLIRMDKVTNAQNELIGQLDVALGGGLSSKEIGSDLSNMDSRNTNSDAYKRGLDAVARMGPEFAETSSAISKTIPAIRGIGTTISQMQAAGDQPGDIQEAISESLLRQGLSNEIVKNISTLLEGEIDPKTIEADIRDKVVKPLADGLEPVRKSINEQLDNQLSILKKLSELDQSRLAIALSGFEASLKTSRAMDKILGVDADPMAERGARVLKGGINLQGTSLQGMPLTGEKGDISKIANLIKQNELKKLDIERQIGEAGPDTKFGLQKEFTDLASETDKLKAAMSALSDVNEENAALEEKLAKSRANREAVRGAATDLAFGTNNDRGKFFKTLNQARGVAFTGSAEIVNPEDRGAVKSFLTTFKNLPAFAGGQTGQQVLDSATKNYLVNQLGVPLEQVDLVMKDFTRSEMDTVELIRANLSIDEVRNTLLENILAAISQNVMFNAPNAALPDRPAGPFLGIGGVNNFSMGGEAPDDPSNIFKPKGSDTVPAMLTPGEFIVSAKYAKRNMRALTEINSGSTKYAFGGMKVEYHKGPENPIAGASYGYAAPYANAKTLEQKKEDDAREAKNKADKAKKDQANRQSQHDAAKIANQKRASIELDMSDNTHRFADIEKRKALGLPSTDEIERKNRRLAVETERNKVLAEAGAKTRESYKTGPTADYDKMSREAKDLANAPKSTSKISDVSPVTYGTIKGDEYFKNDHKKEKLIFPNLRPSRSPMRSPAIGQTRSGPRIPPRKPVFSEPFKLPIANQSPLQPLRMSPATNSSQLSKPNEVYTPLPTPTITETGGTSSLDQLRAAKEAVGSPKPKAPNKQSDVQKRDQLKTEREAIQRQEDRPVTSSSASKKRYAKRIERKTARIDDRIEKLDARNGNQFTGPKTPSDLQSAQVAFSPNGQSRQFAQAAQGASGSSGGQQDFSSLTSSLEAFNTSFSTSVKQLVDMPREFKHDITIPPMSITLNGAEFIAKLPEAMREAIVAQINKQLPEVIAKTTQSQQTGMVTA